MYKEIKKCRICGNKNLDLILNLGNQYLTGTFPKTKDEKITNGPLELFKCHEDKNGNNCGLVQLKQSYNLNEMYGENYGYRSGLNNSMIQHLHSIVDKILNIIPLTKGDLVVDIGSNDGTLLKAYPNEDYKLIGIDPTGNKFKDFYPEYIQLIPEFFSGKHFKKRYRNKKAKIITSIAMFYDIENPIDFMKQIYEILDNEGIWFFEQSYMPTMLDMNAYDTICHEHLEYYRLKQIKWLTDRVGFKIIDIEFNNINGGSFSVMVAKKNSSYRAKEEEVNHILKIEEEKGLSSLKPYEEFSQRVNNHRKALINHIQTIKSEHKLIIGYGASTKGNVILQFCNFNEKDIPYIAEVNEYKFGRFTPGTYIPIISEKRARDMKPDYFLVLPWHFMDNIITREQEYLKSGGKLLFPLPEIKKISQK